MYNSPIDEIKNRLDIVEVVKSYIKLQKVGANYRALCPFHSEKTPSFFVSPSRQIFKCFGCGEGGDIFKFVMKIEGVEFGDALRILAKRAGVTLKKEDPRLRTQRERLYEICELATRFFEKQLEESKTGKAAKEYLLNRGINEASIRKWRLGYAPNTWQALLEFLLRAGYKREEILGTGLAVKKPEGTFYDRFRGRIIFPIFDLNGQVIGFTARIFGEKEGEGVAKYVNTPNTLLYDKSRVLYGLDKAKLAIRQKNECILVEGQTDVIMSHQAGVENVVATSGTALTPFQLEVLKRYTDNLAIAFDMDIAGDSATKRGIDLAQMKGFNVKVITLKENSDPAEVIRENPEDWKKAIERSLSILRFYFENVFSKYDPKTPEGKKEISHILLPLIKKIPNRIVQAHWIEELARRLEVKVEDVEVELRKCALTSSSQDSISSEEKKEISPKSRKEILEERILSLILKKPSLISLIKESHFSLFSPQAMEILKVLKSHPRSSEDLLAIDGLSDELKDFLNQLAFRAELDYDLLSSEGKITIEEECEMCLRELHTLRIKAKLDALAKEIKVSEAKRDFERAMVLSHQFNELTKELHKLHEKKEI